MMARPKALIAWSSGKDSAYALHEVRREGVLEIVGALTTVTGTFSRVSIHGARVALLDAQLAVCGLPSVKVEIPYPCPNGVYEQAMGAAMAQAKAEGVTHVVFGDLFLEDVRAYREARLAEAGLTPVFPLWGRPTDTLARDMIASGMTAHLVCCDLARLDASFAGRSYDAALLADLSPSADPCGENGEFHTFVSDGPMFKRPVPVTRGETVVRDGFAYCDLLPA